MKCSSVEGEMISGPAQRSFYRPISVSHQLLSYCLTVLHLSLSYCLLTVLHLSPSHCLTVLHVWLSYYMSYFALESPHLSFVLLQRLSHCIACFTVSFCQYCLATSVLPSYFYECLMYHLYRHILQCFIIAQFLHGTNFFSPSFCFAYFNADDDYFPS